MMTDIPPVSIALHKKGIPHKIFTHPGALRSLEQAAEERGQRPEQIVRSILFRISRGEYRMVLIAGPTQIDWKTLRQRVGTNRLTMASEEEVLAVTGYPLGAVAPLGLPNPIPILVDHSITREETISMGSGLRGVAIILKSADLLKVLGEGEYECGDFSSK